MRPRLPLPIPVLVALAGIGPLGYWMAPQDGAPGPRIAFVDIQRLFDSDAALLADIERIKARDAAVEEEVRKLRDDLERMMKERDAITDTRSERYLRLSVDLEATQTRMKGLSQVMDALLNHEGVRRNLAAYERFREAIAELAKQRELDVVLRYMPTDAREPELRRRAAELGMVLYHNPKLDVTEDVIKLLKTK